MMCTGTEASIFQCQKSDWGATTGCTHRGDAGVLCTTIPENPYPVQLVNGNETAGRVEIYYNNEWGTICDDHWTLTEANVICHQLGFSNAVAAVSNAE